MLALVLAEYTVSSSSIFRHLPFSAQSASLVQSQHVRVPSQRLSGDNHLGYQRYRRPLSGQVGGVCPTGAARTGVTATRDGVKQAQIQAGGINIYS